MTYIPRGTDGKPMTVAAYYARYDARRAKREEKGLALGLRKPRPQKVKPIAQLSTRGALKKDIVRILGLLSMKQHGKFCRYGRLCPRFRKVGVHAGDTSCHVVPQMRGDAARFVPENVIWGCRDANDGERLNRSLYRDHHMTLLGKDYVERLEAIARTKKKYSTADLLDLRVQLRKNLTDAHQTK